MTYSVANWDFPSPAAPTIAHEIFEQNYGKDHLQIAVALENISNAWGELNNYETKKDLLNQALEIFEKHYGRNHPQIASTLMNLGNTCQKLHDYEDKKKSLHSRPQNQ